MEPVTSAGPGPSWPDRAVAFRQLAQFLVERDEKLPGMLMQARIPGDLVKTSWGGGARLQSLSKAKLAEGLGRLLDQDPFCRRWLCQVYAVGLYQADVRWPGAAERFRWAARWHQPLAETCFLFEDHPKEVPEGCRLEPVGTSPKVHALVPAEALPLDDLVARISADVPALSLSLLDWETARVLDHRSEVRKKLRAGDLPGLVALLATTRTDAITRTFVALFTGDLDAAGKALREHRLGDGRPVIHRRLRILIALATKRLDDAAQLVEELNPALPDDRLLRGLVRVARGELAEGADDLAQVPVHPTSLRTLPYLLAASTLLKSGKSLPKPLERIVQKGCSTQEEREDALAALKTAAAPVPEERPGPAPAPAPPAAAAEPPFPMKEAFAELFAQGHREHQRYQAATRDSHWAVISQASARLQQLESELEGLRERFSKEHGEQAPAAPRHPVSEADGAAYLAALERTWAGARAQRAKALEAERAAVRARFEQVGATPPPEVETAVAVEQLRDILRAHERTLKARGVARECVAAGSVAALSSLPLDLRLAAIEEVVAAGGAGIGDLVTSLSADDAVWAEASQEKAGKALLAGIGATVKRQGTIPAPAWGRLRSAFGAETAQHLRSSGVLEAMEVNPPQELEPLAQVLANAPGVAGPRLSARVAVVRAAALEPAQRVEALAKLALGPEAEDMAVRALFRALVDAGRDGEALFLARAALESDVLANAETEVAACARRVIFRATAVPDEKVHNVVVALLSQTDWFVGSDEDMVLLLYILRQGGLSAELGQVRYTHHAAIDAARGRFPVLTAELLDGDGGRLQDSRRHLEAREALIAFEDELGKTTCYSSWPPAVDYQKEFVRILRARFDAIAAKRTPGAMDSDEMVERARHLPSVPQVTHPALGAMHRYLDAQLGRLDTIAEALKTTTVAELRAMTPPPRNEALREERKRVRMDHPLKQVFDAIGGAP